MPDEAARALGANAASIRGRVGSRRQPSRRVIIDAIPARALSRLAGNASLSDGAVALAACIPGRSGESARRECGVDPGPRRIEKATIAPRHHRRDPGSRAVALGRKGRH
jgi:hypothetical protein